MSLPRDFEFVAKPPTAASPESLVFAFRDRRLLVHLADREVRLPRLGELSEAAGDRRSSLEPIRRQYLGRYGGLDVVSLEMAERADPPEGMAFKGLRSLFGQLAEPLFWLAARAVQIVAWDRDHQICGRCGTPTENQSGEHAKRCPKCKLVQYPRLAPAVIVLVDRGAEVLLGRSPQFPPGMFSTLAGFVEPGESLEQAVTREVREETEIEVANVRYFGSQPWPFPNSLMLGFRADFAAGEVNVDGEELEEASWFRLENLPKIPPRTSIARALIESWIEERRRR